eukprot:7046726-Pyramimonas_sp.AAC.1
MRREAPLMWSRGGAGMVKQVLRRRRRRVRQQRQLERGDGEFEGGHGRGGHHDGRPALLGRAAAECASGAAERGAAGAVEL